MSSLPLVRLITAAPVVAELDRRGLPTDAVLEGMGLTREAVYDTATFVHAMVMYQFLENAAIAADEKHFVADIGERVDPAKWLPTIELSKTATTLGDLLTGWAVSATEHSSAIEQRLDVRGKNALLYGHRSFRTAIVPAQVDGFHAGFLVSILRHAMGSNWRPEEILVTVSDPGALPPIFHGIKAVRGDRRGHKIRFPASWLNRPFSQVDYLLRSQTETGHLAPARTIVDSIVQALMPHIGEPELTIERAAEICSVKPRAFSRLLAGKGTSLTTLLNNLKRDFAIRELTHSDRSVFEIASEMGYSDPTSFARAFKKWTEVSPREYRRSKEVRDVN